MKLSLLSYEERSSTGFSHKAVIPYTDMSSTASTLSATFTMTQLASSSYGAAIGSGANVIAYRIVTPFLGGAIATMVINFGTTFSATAYLNAVDVKGQAAGTWGVVVPSTRLTSDAGANYYFQTTGANLTALTQGQMELYLGRVDMKGVAG